MADSSMPATGSGKGADGRLAPFLLEIRPLIEKQEHQEAIVRIEALMDHDPRDPAALIGLGFIAFASDQIVTALDALKHALETAPRSALAADSLAILYAIAGELAEATFYAKLAQANGLDEDTLNMRPAGWPDFAFVFRNIRERPLLAQGLKQMAAGRSDLGLRLIEAQVAFSPEDGETQRAHADALIAIGRHRQAAEILSRFAANGAADAFDLSRLGRALAAIGDGAATGIIAEALVLG
ncbi:tetratricopeptide repeat protein, partial [Zavarzinia sp.]|uniref:tetratricopeptide repeat protein n=1 Tax=Zavarzinia sp. TaxID=2027920 RepID=UPI003BB61978